MNINNILNIKYPIIQGGMAHISTAEFAAKVSELGALGQIASGGFTAEQVRSGIKKIRTLTDKAFGVNVVILNKDIDKLAEVVIEEKVDIITVGAGNPKPYMKKWIDAGIRVIPIIANIKMAKSVEALGASAVIFEGAEAGGHIGSLNTFPELPAIVDSVNIPVICAGGVYNGKHMFAAEVLGACGVQIGSRLLVAEETPIDEAYKKALIEGKDSDTIVTGITTKAPVRVIKNELAKRLNEIEIGSKDMDEFFKLATGSTKRAVDGDIDMGSILCGQGIYYLNKIESLKDIIENLMKDYLQVKKTWNCN